MPAKLTSHLTFRFKLSIMMFVVISLTLIASAYYQYHYSNETVETQKLQLLELDNQLIAQQATYALLERNDQLAGLLVNDVGQNPAVDEVALVTTNHTILNYFSRTKDLPIPEIDFEKEIIKTPSHLKMTVPVLVNSNVVGYVYISYLRNVLFPKDQFYPIYILVTLLIMTIIAILIADRLQRILTKPIVNMVKHIENIYRTGNFESRLKESHDNEIGELVSGFNKMLQTVQERENELTIRSKQLQRLVDVRTEQLYQKAHFDSLTGLPNRYLLVDRLHQAIAKSSRSNNKLALLFLDLDRFKIINDNLGHQNGDQLLKEVAKRLLKLSRQSDTVARLGGDEFVFLLENLSSLKSAARTAKRIIESFKVPFRIQDHILHVSTSIGISIYPEDGDDEKALLKNADISMYHAKQQGSGKYSFYTNEINQTSLERLKIESQLRAALENDELHMVYQPQKNLNKKRIENLEALIRWNSPKNGPISPGIFIPIAEETGLINQIDLWVISKVCKQISIWNKIGLNHLTVAINVSAGHLISEILLNHLEREVKKHNIDASQIEIEITEAVFVEHTNQTIENLKKLKAFGVKIAIDDFGTGYSSLQYIQNFPADTLKLDGMFVQSLDTKASQGIVRSTIILAHSLGLELVAECVETQAQLDFLIEHKCDLIQGYLFSKPLLPEDIPTKCLE